MTELDLKVQEKRSILRREYGGLMSCTDLCRELRIRRPQARAWGEDHGVAIMVGQRIKYDTDEVARIIVEGRGMV